MRTRRALGHGLLPVVLCWPLACGSAAQHPGPAEGGDGGSSAGDAAQAGAASPVGGVGAGFARGGAESGGVTQGASAGDAAMVGDAGTPSVIANAGALEGGTEGLSGESNGGGSGATFETAGAPNGGTSSAGTANGGASGAGASTAGNGNGQRVSLLTRSYDNQRSNANLREAELVVSTVNSAQFGKLFELPVDDDVYAQILYVPSLSLASSGVHNVIFVATVNNSVYAFDADTPGSPLWQRNFNGAGHPTQAVDVGQACQFYGDFSGNIGIVSTPVIDAQSSSMYVVSRTVFGSTPIIQLHRLDIRSGDELPGSPIAIGASVTNLAGQAVVFDPALHNQRMSLALSEGTLYVGFASFCDTGDYHGWLLAYDATSLAQVGVFNDTPDGSQAGIWQAGAAPAFDADGNLYAMTGNGSFDGVTNFAESVLKLQKRSLGVLDYFTPSNYANLSRFDVDLGSAGPIWLPGVNLVAGGGKQGKLYLMDPNNMGHTAWGDGSVLQSFQAVDLTIRPSGSHHIHNGLASWRGPRGLHVYLAGENDYIHAFHLNEAERRFDLPAAFDSAVLPPAGMPGGMLTISANGAASGSGILWSATPRVGDANQMVVPGMLRAYDAETLALLWESTAPADETFDFAKFSNPAVVAGKVYEASFSRLISVYGRNPPRPENLALNKSASGSEPCAADQGAANAVNGSVILGNSDKWCSAATSKFLQVDLGANLLLKRVVLRHANAGGERLERNTRDFSVTLSADGVQFNTVADVSGNRASITRHEFSPQSARYVRVNVSVGSQLANDAAEIYELEVYAP